MGCNDSYDEFDNDTKRVSNNFLENNKLISNVHSQLDHLKSNNFNKYSVTNAKDTFDDLFSRHERIKPLDLNKPGAGWASNKSESSIEKYSPVELYIKSILDNENATELAITFLRKELGKDKQKNQDALNTFENYEDNIANLEKARKNEAQNTEVLSNNVKILTKKLENIFTNNLKTLDEPQYAKKILPHLLKDRLNKIKRDRVFLMNNLVHIAQKEKLKQSLEGTPA